MPLIGARDPLPAQPERIAIAGASGAGKSTLARQIAAALDLPYVEIDSLFHGPDWTRRPTFAEDVERLSAGPRWVVEWQYPEARPLLTQRADLMAWLDLPRSVVMRQIVARTVRRRAGRERLWNDNVEPPLRMIFTDRDHIVRWAWRTHHETALRIAEVTEERPDLPVVRLRSQSEASAWVALVRGGSARPSS